MTNYSKLKKLDEESLKALTEGVGPTDECLCSLLAPPEDHPGVLGAMGASIKRAFSALGGGKRRQSAVAGQKGRVAGQKGTGLSITGQGEKTVKIPLTYTKGGQGIYTTKEVVERSSDCGKCGCDGKKFVLKHSFANIRIVSPDISSLCPCPSDCLPDKEKLINNIQVTIEQAQIVPGFVQSESTVHKVTSDPRGDNSELSQETVSEDDPTSDWSFDDDKRDSLPNVHF